MKKPLLIFIFSIILLFFFFLAFQLISNQNKQNLTEEKAILIIDGDTFQTSEGEIIRLLCVDTPEKNTEGYEEATAYLSALILGKNVEIERQGKDKYNRTLAWIYQNNILINKEILENSFGKIFEYGNTDCNKVK